MAALICSMTFRSTFPPQSTLPTKTFFISTKSSSSPSLSRGKRFHGNVSIRPPPPNFDFRSETLEDTVSTIKQMYPQLSDLVEEGSIVVVKRPHDYVERRSDGYVEPEMVIVVGTSHVSDDSAAHVERVLKAVRPENVVVELCRSRQFYSQSPNPF
eukprot:Gb_34280 [translate_table: standard]